MRGFGFKQYCAFNILISANYFWRKMVAPTLIPLK